MNSDHAGHILKNGDCSETESGVARLQLSETIDVSVLQSLMENFYSLTQMPMALIDLQGEVLAGAGWQKVCTQFHRKHHDTHRHCIESDTKITADIREGEYRIYKCMNNMWDAATPVVVNSVHVANLFTGQFFFDDELPDRELFRAQAAKYGFPEDEYLTAIDEVPRLSRTAVESALTYFTKLATIISQLSHSNGKLARTLAEKDSLLHSLEKSRKRLASAQKIAHLGSWELDLVNNELTWSDEVYRIFGLEPQEFAPTYETFLQAVHPDDRAAVDSAYSRSLRESRDLYEIEHWVVRKSGEVRFVHEKCRHFRDDAGAIIRSVGMVHDITERKQTEDALRESELFYRQTLESIPGMVFTTRPDGYCDYQSQQWVDFTGVPMNEHLGDGWSKLLHPDDRPRAFAAWRAAVEEQAPYDLEYRVRRHDGEYEWFKVRGRPIRNETGEIVRWFGTALNIDQMVLTQEELRQAKTAAEAASLAKSEFLANMSHEIRTPMTVFMAALDHLQQIDRNPEHSPLLEMAGKSAKRLRVLVDDILDFSRIEAGRVEIGEEPFDLRACLGGVVQMFALPAREKGLLLEMDISPDTPYLVLGDPSRLDQVLTNLVGNAIKFTHEGGVKICVQPRGGSLEFSVVDTGIGIPEEKRHLLFQSFSQVDASFHRQFGGTGLGLAISKGLVELMGGEISVRSTNEGGCIFTFFLPMKTAESLNFGAAEVLSDNSGENVAARILLAEDDPMICQLINIILSKRGWHTDTAKSGREALEKWEKGSYDVLLMDLQMPEMDGIEATRTIRQKRGSGEKRTCIIGLTAHALREIHEICLEAGMDKVLTKPVQMNDLYLAIDECLSE